MPKSAASTRVRKGDPMSNLEIACNEVQEILVLFIDHELPSEDQYPVVEFHFQQCEPCYELLEHERAAISMMQDLLRGSCSESAPEELHARIRATIDQLASGFGAGFNGSGSVEYYSQTTITEITFDGTTSIEITQEFTQEIRHDFPRE